MSKKLLIIIISFFTLPTFVFASASPNTGFIRDTVWFSDGSPKADDNIDVYVALFNGEKSEISFKISLLDNGVTLQSKEIDISPEKSGTLDFNWKVSNGRHKFIAIIDSAEINGKTLEVVKTQTNSASLNIGVSSEDNDGVSSPSQLLSNINFKEGSYGEKVKISIINFLDKVETWRKDEDGKIDNSIDKVEKDRQSDQSSKPAIQGVTFLHLIGIKIVHFIFSIQALFYTVILAILYWVLRVIFRLFAKIFRKQA